MSPALARVHFASGSVDSQNDITQTKSPTPWSQRQPILNKLLPTLADYASSLLNTTNIQSAHVHQILHQINQDHTHFLDRQIGSLVEAAQITLKPTRGLNPDHLGPSQEGSPAERRLMERVLKCQLDPNTDFISVRELSSSECGKVELVKSRLSKDEDRNQKNVFVLKTIYKSAAVRMREHIFPEAELAILQLSRSNSSTHHTHQAFVPHLHASFQSSDALHLLTSYIPGRTLADFLSSPIRSSLELEPVVRQWAAEIVLGLNWLHTTHRWVHRDLKPSNILLRANGHLVLNDFGTAAPLICVEPPVIDQYHLDRHGHQVVYKHSKLRVPKRYARTLVGTCDYIAPEILHTHLHTVMDIIDRDENQSIVEQEDEPGSYGPEVDWWSLGITLYELLYNRPPFYSPAISTTYEQIVSHQQFLRFPNTSGLMAPSTSISANAKNFIKSLLSDPSCRLGSGPTGLAEIQSHAWFRTLDWSTLLTRESAYKPVCEPIEPQEQTIEARVNGGFNFSAFFASSPGLSVLRSVVRPTQRHEPDSDDDDIKQHEKLWIGFSLLPKDPEAFEIDTEGKFGSNNQSKSSLLMMSSSTNRINQYVDGFVTPIRPGIKFSTINNNMNMISGKKLGRGMSDLEEWKELVDIVTMTAQKKKQEKEQEVLDVEDEDEEVVVEDGLNILESRALSLLETVEEVIDRYENLFEFVDEN